MRRLGFLFLVFLAVILGVVNCHRSGTHDPAFHPSAGKKPFHRVQIFSGGGFQSAMFLGYFDGLSAKGWNPDAVIGTCGGALAALLVNAIPNADDRLEILLSKEFYHQLQTIQINVDKTTNSAFASYVAQLHLQALRAYPYLPLPNAFNQSDVVLWLPRHFLFTPAQRFFLNSPTPTIIVGSKFLFGPGENGLQMQDRQRKWYREIYFTDSKTARYLGHPSSSIARQFPQSAVDPETEVHTDWTLGDAARTSMSDIRYIQPVKKGQDYFGGGFIDLVPLEMALELGDEVALTRPGDFSHLENTVVRTSFGMDGNERFRYLKQVLGTQPTISPRLHWLDSSDLDEIYDRCGMNPHLVIGFHSHMDNRIPTDYAEYTRRVHCLYQYGLQKAGEVALSRR